MALTVGLPIANLVAIRDERSAPEATAASTRYWARLSSSEARSRRREARASARTASTPRAASIDAGCAGFDVDGGSVAAGTPTE